MRGLDCLAATTYTAMWRRGSGFTLTMPERWGAPAGGESGRRVESAPVGVLRLLRCLRLSDRGGHRVPSLQVIHEFARRLHVSPEYLATGSTSEDEETLPCFRPRSRFAWAIRKRPSGCSGVCRRGRLFQARAVAGLGSWRSGRPIGRGDHTSRSRRGALRAAPSR